MINNETLGHRYLFTVRQGFGKKPVVDCFYEVKSPGGITGAELKTWQAINPDWEKESINSDSHALHGMELRLRFNSDMYQHVCLVKSAVEISGDDLELIIELKHSDDTLMEFLQEATI